MAHSGSPPENFSASLPTTASPTTLSRNATLTSTDLLVSDLGSRSHTTLVTNSQPHIPFPSAIEVLQLMETIQRGIYLKLDQFEERFKDVCRRLDTAPLPSANEHTDQSPQKFARPCDRSEPSLQVPEVIIITPSSPRVVGPFEEEKKNSVHPRFLGQNLKAQNRSVSVPDMTYMLATPHANRGTARLDSLRKLRLKKLHSDLISNGFDLQDLVDLNSGDDTPKAPGLDLPSRGPPQQKQHLSPLCSREPSRLLSSSTTNELLFVAPSARNGTEFQIQSRYADLQPGTAEIPMMDVPRQLSMLSDVLPVCPSTVTRVGLPSSINPQQPSPLLAPSRTKGLSVPPLSLPRRLPSRQELLALPAAIPSICSSIASAVVRRTTSSSYGGGGGGHGPMNAKANGVHVAYEGITSDLEEGSIAAPSPKDPEDRIGSGEESLMGLKNAVRETGSVNHESPGACAEKVSRKRAASWKVPFQQHGRMDWTVQVLFSLLSVAEFTWVLSRCATTNWNSPPARWEMDFAVFLTCFYVCAVGFHFLVSKRQDWTIHTSFNEVRRIYLHGWFAFDTLVTFPYDLVSLLFCVPYGFRVCGLIRCLRLLRLFRLFQSSHPMKPLDGRIRAFVIGLFVTLSFLVVGLIWLWTQPRGGINGGEGGNTAELLMDSLYWAITTLSTTGYGDIVPKTPGQKLYCVFIMMLGSTLFGYIVGNLSMIMWRTGMQNQAENEKKQRLLEVMEFYHVPWSVQQHIMALFPHLQRSLRATQLHSDIITLLPISVQQNLQRYMKLELLSAVPFFHGLEMVVFEEIADQLVESIVPPGDIVIRTGEYGQEMYFIADGLVEVLLVKESGELQALANLHQGQFFGEIALFLHVPRTATVRAITPTTLFSLKVENFQQVIAKFPELHEAVKEEATRRMAAVNKQTSSSSPNRAPDSAPTFVEQSALSQNNQKDFHETGLPNQDSSKTVTQPSIVSHNPSAMAPTTTALPRQRSAPALRPDSTTTSLPSPTNRQRPQLATASTAFDFPVVPSIGSSVVTSASASSTSSQPHQPTSLSPRAAAARRVSTRPMPYPRTSSAIVTTRSGSSQGPPTSPASSHDVLPQAHEPPTRTNSSLPPLPSEPPRTSSTSSSNIDGGHTLDSPALSPGPLCIVYDDEHRGEAETHPDFSINPLSDDAKSPRARIGSAPNAGFFRRFHRKLSVVSTNPLVTGLPPSSPKQSQQQHQNRKPLGKAPAEDVPFSDILTGVEEKGPGSV